MIIGELGVQLVPLNPKEVEALHSCGCGCNNNLVWVDDIYIPAYYFIDMVHLLFILLLLIKTSQL